MYEAGGGPALIRKTEETFVEATPREGWHRRIAEILADGVCATLRAEGLLRSSSADSVAGRGVLMEFEGAEDRANAEVSPGHTERSR